MRIAFGVCLLLLYSFAAAEDLDVALIQQSIPSQVVTHLTVDININGNSRPMLLDTGAQITVLDPLFRPGISVEIERNNIHFLGGISRPTILHEGPPLKIGTTHFEKPAVIFHDMETFSRITGRPLAGMLGMDLIANNKIFLCFEKSYLAIHSGRWILDNQNFQEVELKRPIGTPVFDSNIAGHPVTFGIDTGYNGSILLIASVFQKLVLEGIIEESNINVRTITPGGEISVKRGWFQSGRLMGKELIGISVMSDPKTSRLGLTWLYAFNTEIDFSGRKFRYQTRANASPPIDVQMMMGCMLTYDAKGAHVESLRPGGGTAENTGLKQGDVIESFGSLTAKELNAASIGNAVANGAGNDIKILFLRKGDGKHIETRFHLPPAISQWDFAGRSLIK